MSFCYLHGILPVCDGRRVQTVKANGAAIWHSVYDTMIEMESGSDLQGIFRAYSPPSQANLPSNTLIIANGKFGFPMSGDGSDGLPEFIVEPASFAPFTMDLTSSEPDSFLPIKRVPSLHLLGTVVGSVVHFSDGGKGVDVRVSNYLQGKTLDCLYRCRFAPGPRWAKINVPIAGSVLAILGRPYDTTNPDGTGLLIVNVDDVVYNPGTAHVLDDSQSDTSGPPRKLQVKKRKRSPDEVVRETIAEDAKISDGYDESRTGNGNVSNGALLSSTSGSAVVSLDANEPDSNEIGENGKKRVKAPAGGKKKLKGEAQKSVKVVQTQSARTRSGTKRTDKSKSKIVEPEDAMGGELTDIDDEAANPSGAGFVERDGIEATPSKADA